MREYASSGIRWLESERLKCAGARAAWTLRTGGVSAPPYDSLNLGLHVGDESASVLENRERVARVLGLSATDCVYAEQVHGGKLSTVALSERGRGARSHADAMPDADALLTSEPGLPLVVLSADCLLLALGAPDGVVAAVHASWRSTAAGLVEISARSLAEHTDSRPGEIVAAFGPRLGPCCYEVKEDMREAFLAARGEDAARFFETREGRSFFHLERAVRAQLDSAGLARENVESAGQCTACAAEEFFSHRRDGGRTDDGGQTGRNALVVLRRER